MAATILPWVLCCYPWNPEEVAKPDTQVTLGGLATGHLLFEFGFLLLVLICALEQNIICTILRQSCHLVLFDMGIWAYCNHPDSNLAFISCDLIWRIYVILGFVLRLRTVFIYSTYTLDVVSICQIKMINTYVPILLYVLYKDVYRAHQLFWGGFWWLIVNILVIIAVFTRALWYFLRFVIDAVNWFEFNF